MSQLSEPLHTSLIALTAPSKLFVYVLEDPVSPKAPRRQGCLSLRRILFPAVFVYNDCSIYVFEWKHHKAWVAPIEAGAATGGEQSSVFWGICGRTGVSLTREHELGHGEAGTPGWDRGSAVSR